MPLSLPLSLSLGPDHLTSSVSHFDFAEGTRPVSFATETEEEVEQFSCSTCTYVHVRREKGETEEGPVTFVVATKLAAIVDRLGPKIAGLDRWNS